MRTKVVIFILATFMLCSCKTHYVTVEKEIPVETVKVEYRTIAKVDSVWVHDSVGTRLSGDTVLIDRVRSVYKYLREVDTLCVTDSVDRPIYVNTETVTEVRRLTAGQRILAWSGVVAWILLLLFLLGKFKDKLGIDK